MGSVRLQLAELAHARGLTMSQVARRTGLTPAMVRRYWRNETTTVSLEAIGNLAQLLDVQPGDLLTHDPASAEAAEDVRLG